MNHSEVTETTFGELPVGTLFRFHDGVNNPGDLLRKLSDRQAKVESLHRHGARLSMGPRDKVLGIFQPALTGTPADYYSDPRRTEFGD
jgi:hypothetical protein